MKKNTAKRKPPAKLSKSQRPVRVPNPVSLSEDEADGIIVMRRVAEQEHAAIPLDEWLRSNGYELVRAHPARRRP